METVFIDGSTGEGGGQILRTSLALACITGKTLRIENIRAARRNPGMAKQHLSCVHAASQICNACCDGAALGSKTLDFQPGIVRSGDYHFDIGSAGSATLVIQTVLPALFLADSPSTVTVTGGTHNPLAPPFDFLCETFLPAIATAGFYGNCKLIKPGFYPAGGGKITFEIQPATCPPNVWRINLAGKPWERRPDKIIDLCKRTEQLVTCARIYLARLPIHITQHQEKLLCQSNLGIKNIEHIEVTNSDGPGNCVMLRFIGAPPPFLSSTEDTGAKATVFTAFGMKGKPSQEVVSEVVNLAKDFLSSDAAVDRFLADQLLIYMAFSQAGCFTTNELSSHLRTNIEVIKKFLPVDFTIDQQKQSYKVCCQPV